ncbi:hypothetical protein [Streptomyces hoynatensis]|uniref:DUF4034 domain-containing protein n=1 Tax=Streptomyces hoynatensis TaxID=1141874 RepID=A0A3A9ZAZ7_9ACTN|nr:hypothetical protein [Streptomyces hoynatensis]RKN44984.1 hypothetical protein D7294_07745 [Streptomyces hoynatensis]
MTQAGLRLWPRIVRHGEEVRRAARRRDWPEVRRQILAAPQEDWAMPLSGLRGVADVRPWLAGLIATEPEPALALLASGSCHIVWAWDAYTAAAKAAGRDIDHRRCPEFQERLRIAEAHLHEAIEREPTWAEPWHQLLFTARGLHVGPDAARERFETAVRLVPGHLGAHAQYLQQLTPKWGGSEEAAHHFAHAVTAGAPPGSPLGVLIAQAHLESMVARKGGALAYLRRPAVRRDLHEAAERSVRHPAYRRTAGWIWQHNVFAMAFALAGEREAARDMFRLLGGRISASPWSYLNAGPVRGYRQWRHRCGVWL